MKSPFDLFRRLIILGVAARLAATPTIEISTGSTASPVRLSLSVENRVAARVPQAPDLATAYWVVAPLPVVVPAGHGYYGAVRSINAHGDALGNDLSLIKHVAADGAVTSLGSYNFHFNGGRQLDDAGRVVLNSRLGTDGFLFKVSGGSASEGVRYAGTRLTSLDNAGGLLGVTLSETNQSDRDYWGLHFVEREDRRRELELPADSNFGADLMALNERDEVVGGAFQIPSNWWRGLYLKPGRAPRWLPGFGEYEDVYNLNVHGQLVGSTAVPAGFGYAAGVYPALWDSGAVGRVKVLDTDRSLFGGEYGWAWAANRWGHIVGRTRSGGALWLNGSPYDFSGRIINPDNIRLDYFADINDKGEIVGAEYGSRNLPASRAFIMRPVWPSLAVDLNRDGKIALPIDGDKSDVTSPAMPFRFWINDDDDGNALNGETEVEGGSSRDYETRGDFGISSKRDLEDFARLRIYSPGCVSALKTGDLQMGLQWKEETVSGSPAINLNLHYESDGGLRYLTDDATAIQQTTPPYSSTLIGVGEKNVVVAKDGPFIIKKETLAGLLNDQENIHLLFEAAGIGTGQLQLVLLDKNGNQIGEVSDVWLDLRTVDTMFERVKVSTQYALSSDGVDATMPLPHDYIDPLQVPQPTMGWKSDDRGKTFVPDPGEDTQNKNYIIFVHGWRQAPGIPPSGVSSSLTYARTMFKRLWRAGYKGRFAAFRWPTFYGGPGPEDDDPLRGFTTYNDSEYRAWKSGQSLAQYMNQLPFDYKRHLVAHSMGNIVAGSAFKYGLSVDNYALLNAAVPAICYQGSAQRRWPTFSGVNASVVLHRDYNVPSPTPSAPYSGTPVDDSSATVRALSYVDQFSVLNTRTVSFYLESDFATSISWNANNMVFRPNTFAIPLDGSSGYRYVSGVTDPDWRLRLTSFSAGERRVSEAHEVMSYDCKVPTFTAGADGSTGGAISKAIDMGAYGFGSEHSAQWQWRLQQTVQFYRDLIFEFGLNSTL